jgi:hypothetical protein
VIRRGHDDQDSKYSLRYPVAIRTGNGLTDTRKNDFFAGIKCPAQIYIIMSD